MFPFLATIQQIHHNYSAYKAMTFSSDIWKYPSQIMLQNRIQIKALLAFPSGVHEDCKI